MENKDNKKVNNDETEEQFDESQYEGQNTERVDEEEWQAEQQDEELNTERQDDDDEDDRLNEEHYEEQFTERRDEDETLTERKEQREEEHDEEENLTHIQEEQVSKRMVKENLTQMLDELDFAEEPDEEDHFSESRQEDLDTERSVKDQNETYKEGHTNIPGSPNQIDSQEIQTIADDLMPTENQAEECSQSVRANSPAFPLEATEDIGRNDPRTTSPVTTYKDAAATGILCVFILTEHFSGHRLL